MLTCMRAVSYRAGADGAGSRSAGGAESDIDMPRCVRVWLRQGAGAARSSSGQAIQAVCAMRAHGRHRHRTWRLYR